MEEGEEGLLSPLGPLLLSFLGKRSIAGRCALITFSRGEGKKGPSLKRGLAHVHEEVHTAKQVGMARAEKSYMGGKRKWKSVITLNSIVAIRRGVVVHTDIIFCQRTRKGRGGG